MKTTKTTRTTRTIVIAVLATALALAASACGGQGATRAADAGPAPSTTAVVSRPTSPRDERVGPEGGQLHLRCVGRGATTVLLIAGWGDGGGQSWGAVEPGIAESARVCTYDRFGTGESDAPRTTQTFTTQAADLHALLDRAGEPGPYVVVGHSFGGAEAVSFASQYGDEVAGLVLVDASPTSWPDAVCAVPDDGTEAAAGFRSVCARMHDPSLDAEQLDVARAFEEVAAITSLGGLPMTVVTSAHRTAPGLAELAVSQLDTAWDEGVRTWAALSGNSTVVTVDGTGHYIQLERPDLVVTQVSKLLP